MRDTIIGLTLLLSLVGGYFVFRAKPNTQEESINLKQQEAPLTKTPAENTLSKPQKLLTRKVKHERTKHRLSRQTENSKHNQGSRRVVVEAEKLPTIYEKQIEQPESVNSEGEGTKSLYGVPVDSWVLSHQNSVATRPSDPKLAEGIRLFVGCMEIKKQGAEELTKRDCEKIALRNERNESIR